MVPVDKTLQYTPTVYSTIYSYGEYDIAVFFAGAKSMCSFLGICFLLSQNLEMVMCT